MKTYMKKAIAQGIATKQTKATGKKFEVVAYDDGFRVMEVVAVEKKVAPKAKKQTRSAPVPNTEVYGSDENERARLLRDTKAYFEANYEFDGNDIVVETMDDAQLIGYIGKSKKLLGAVMNVRYFGAVKAIHEAREEAKAGAY